MANLSINRHVVKIKNEDPKQTPSSNLTLTMYPPSSFSGMLINGYASLSTLRNHNSLIILRY